MPQIINIMIFWDETPCSLVVKYPHLGGIHCFHLWVDKSSLVQANALISDLTSYKPFTDTSIQSILSKAIYSDDDGKYNNYHTVQCIYMTLTIINTSTVLYI
jgi:hypothetical protein